MEMPTTYVVYKGRVPGVYDDWEDCRRQVHRFSGNSYKGYPTRVEAEGRYARYLAGEMRDMRRNRMKTMAFVMMVIVTMLFMFYVIVV
jgi:viroplasmin and RNaseH domain-containing protein